MSRGTIKNFATKNFACDFDCVRFEPLRDELQSVELMSILWIETDNSAGGIARLS